MIRLDSIGGVGLRSRFKYGLDGASSKTKFLFLIYFFGLPALFFILYAIFYFLGEMHLGMMPSRGQMLLSLMISYRFTLALFGAILVLGISIFYGY